MPALKNNIGTPFQTETYWIYNPFLSHMPRLLLIINTIYEVGADFYLHVQGRFSERWHKVGEEIEELLLWFFKMGSISVFSQIKAAIQKRLWPNDTYLQPAMFQLLLSSSLLRTRQLAACPLLTVNIKDVHTELINPGHLYNNTFAQSPWCPFDLEKWPTLPFVSNMVISSKCPLDVKSMRRRPQLKA